MVKGRQGERVRLYVRGTILGYKRSKSNQYPNTSLIQIEGVNSKEEVAWYHGKRMAYIYKAKVKQNGTHYSPWEPEFASSCTLATFEVFLRSRGTEFEQWWLLEGSVLPSFYSLFWSYNASEGEVRKYGFISFKYKINGGG
ncbi:unnamed protein product [Fraxinus pennsylvanica]|uniref:Ribosomal protein L35Ae n=1 Tax=Fraxinus pennsylvanica TaxID=56036 RepID=A0AAD1ZSH4_9LAMI|nr:unnamed protein product [Fraxinus pennsylvanica]